MDKAYRKQRAKLHKRRTAEQVSLGGGLWVRIMICLLAFLIFAGIQFYGGALQRQVGEQVRYYMQGASAVPEAYKESVEAFNRFCDRIVENRAADD